MWEAGIDRAAASVAWIAAALSAQLILRPPTLTAYEVDHLSAVRVLAPECMVLLRSDGAFPLEQPGEIALFGSGARTWPGRSGPAPPARRQSPPWCRSMPNIGSLYALSGLVLVARYDENASSEACR